MSFSGFVKTTPALLLYANAGVAAATGIWLVYNGQLIGVWPMFLAFIFSPVVLPIVLLPTGFFAGVLRVISNGGGPKPLVAILSVLSIGWLIIAMSGYALLCYHELMTAAAVLPLYAKIYGCGIALAPFALLASKDRENLLFVGLVWFMQIAVIATTLLPPVLQIEWDSWRNFGLLVAIMGLFTLLQAAAEALFLGKTPPGSNLPDVPGGDISV